MSRLSVIVVAILLAGCLPSRTAPRYSTTADSLVALKNFKGKQIQVRKFTSSSASHSITCRGLAPIQPPDGLTFAEFIRRALITDLKFAEIYAPNAPTVITGNLNHISFDSVGGVWDISLTVKSGEKTPLTAIEKYSFATSLNGDAACNLTAQALTPAVQNLISKLTQSQYFRELIE